VIALKQQVRRSDVFCTVRHEQTGHKRTSLLFDRLDLLLQFVAPWLVRLGQRSQVFAERLRLFLQSRVVLFDCRLFGSQIERPVVGKLHGREECPKAVMVGL
jgi:hypothetical protein